MVYNGILMETIGISVMVSIGLLSFFSLAGKSLYYNDILYKYIVYYINIYFI